MKLQQDSNPQPLRGCGLEFRCILRYHACFERGVPWDIQATRECRFILKRVRDMIRTYIQKKMNLLICSKQDIDEDILRLSNFLAFSLFAILFPSSKQKCTNNATVTYLEENLCTLSLFKMEPFPAIVNDLYQLTSFAKSSILNNSTLNNRLRCMWSLAPSFRSHVVFL